MTITVTSTDTTVSYTNERGYTTTIDKELLGPTEGETVSFTNERGYTTTIDKELMGTTEPKCDTDEVWLDIDHLLGVIQLLKLPKGKTRKDIQDVKLDYSDINMTFTDGSEMKYQVDMSLQDILGILDVRTSDGVTYISHNQ